MMRQVVSVTELPIAAGEWQLPPGIRVVTDVDSMEWQLADGIEARAFIAREFAGDEAGHAAEYALHRPVSHYLVDEGLRGAVRVMLPSAAGFKTINDAHRGLLKITDEGWKFLTSLNHEAFVVECNIAVERAYRSRPLDPNGITNYLVNAALMYALQLAELRNIPPERVHILAGFDEQAFHLFARLYGAAVHPLGPAVDYMGSPTVPTILSVQEMIDYDENAKRRRMLIYAGGVGLYGH